LDQRNFLFAVLKNDELVILVEFRHCLEQVARVSADSGRLMVHQAGIDAYTHKEFTGNRTWGGKCT
jgi:hypothetical protein